jgi:excisionase family DNA binding protein
MTSKEAAEFLGFANSSRIRQLVLAGKIRAEKPGRDWLIDESSVREYGEQMQVRLPDKKRCK